MALPNRDDIATRIMAALIRSESRPVGLTILDAEGLARYSVKAADALLAELHPPKPKQEVIRWVREKSEDGDVFYCIATDKYRVALFKDVAPPDGSGPGNWAVYITGKTDKVPDRPVVRFKAKSLDEAKAEALWQATHQKVG